MHSRVRGCNPNLQIVRLTEVGNKPPTLEGWPIDWLPVGQLLIGVPLTVRVSLLLLAIGFRTCSRAVGTRRLSAAPSVVVRKLLTGQHEVKGSFPQATKEGTGPA